MKTLIIIRGPLGVGKTTIAKLVAKHLNLNYLSVDEILDQHHLGTSDGISVADFITTNKYIISLTKETSTSTIVDGNFYYQEQIDNLIEQFPNNYYIFTLTSDVETCIKRDAERKKSYGEASTRFVYEMTMEIKVGIEIDCTNETIEKIVDNLVDRID